MNAGDRDARDAAEADLVEYIRRHRSAIDQLDVYLHDRLLLSHDGGSSYILHAPCDREHRVIPLDP